jgi:copper chaperone CopZ
MHFAAPKTLVALALGWAIFLVAYDQHANPRPLSTYWAEFKGSSTRPTVVSEGDTPRIRLSMPHLCCTGCLDEIHASLKSLAWLAPARLATEPPAIDAVEASPATAETAHEIEFDILDLRKADFVALRRALEDSGLVPDRIELFGMGHFRLEVGLPHLCCTVCSKAVDQQLERLLRKETQGRWLDSLTMNHVEKTVTIYARLNSVVDVLELIRALDQAGFAAQTIRATTDPE